MGLKKALAVLVVSVVMLLLTLSFLVSSSSAQAALPEIDGLYWWTNSEVDLIPSSTGASGTASCEGYYCSGVAYAAPTAYSDAVGTVTVNGIVSDTSVSYAMVFRATPLNLSERWVYYTSGESEIICYKINTLNDTTYNTWASENCDVNGNVVHSTVDGQYYSMGTPWNDAPLEWGFEFELIGILKETEEPTGGDLDGGEPWAGSCVFSTTVAVEDSPGVTTTIEYTRPANLVSNGSFEIANGSNPYDWQPAVSGAFTSIPYYYAADQAESAHTGSASVYNGGNFDLYQNMPLYAAGQYEVGFYATGENATMLWNGEVVAAPGTITGTYTLVTGTRTTAGGSAWLDIAFTSPFVVSIGGDTYVDDVYIIPIDENGDLLCLADYYAPYEPGEEDELPDTIPNPGGDPIIAPDGGGVGYKCYECVKPNNPLQIGGWIAYLACFIKNLFSCSLRSWFQTLGNWIAGVWQSLVALINWLPTVAQGIINWARTQLASWWAYFTDWVSMLWAAMVNIPRQLLINFLQSEFVQSLWQQYGWLRAMFAAARLLIDMFVQMITDLYNAVVSFIEFLIELFGKIRDAFGTDPFQIVVITSEGQEIGDIGPESLYAPGASPTKVLWIFLSAVGAIDVLVDMYSPYLPAVLVLVIGALALGVFFWTLKLWHDIVPI